MVQLSHPYMTTGKTVALTTRNCIRKVISLLFNILSRFVIVFLPKSKLLLISWLQSLSSVILEAKKIICHCFHFFLIYSPWNDGTGCHDLSFFNVVLSQLFHCPLSPSSRGSLVPLHFLLLEWHHLHIWGYWYFSWQCWFQLMIQPAHHLSWWTLHISLINRVTIYSHVIFLSQFWISPLFHVRFSLLFLDPHTGFSGDS